MKLFLGLVFVLMIFTIPQVFAYENENSINMTNPRFLDASGNEILPENGYNHEMYTTVDIENLTNSTIQFVYTVDTEHHFEGEEVMSIEWVDGEILAGEILSPQVIFMSSLLGNKTVYIDVVNNLEDNQSLLLKNMTFNVFVDYDSPTVVVNRDKWQYNQIDTISITGKMHKFDIPDNSTVSVWMHLTSDYPWEEPTMMMEYVDVPIIENTFSYDFITDGDQWRNHTSTNIMIKAEYQNQLGARSFTYSDYPAGISLYSLHDMYYTMMEIIDYHNARIAELEIDEEFNLYCGEPENHYNDIHMENGGDVRNGTAGPDLIFGGNGPDIIYGLGGDDCIFGGNGADTIYGGTGDDEIHGGHGNDFIDGGEGNDIAEGHKGKDTCINSEITIDCEIVDVPPNNPTPPDDPKPPEGNGPFCGEEKSFYDNVINGTAGNDVLVGTPQNDLILGLEGDDLLKGKPGNDCLIGGTGYDTLQGGKGVDICLEGEDVDKSCEYQ